MTRSKSIIISLSFLNYHNLFNWMSAFEYGTILTILCWCGGCKMKSLLLLRHAKSSWNDSNLPDQERPLNPRGKRDAPRMGRLLLDKKLVPDLILSSTAKRARKTVKKVVRACGYPGKIKYTEALYASDAENYLHLLAQQGSEFERILIVGHNPEIELFLNLLTGCQENMPTAALAYIQLTIEHWEDISCKSNGNLLAVWRPKKLST